MNADICRRLIARDVRGLRDQLAAYPDEALLWTRPEGISNPPGNLALHIEGNLRHYIGHVLGGSDYRRDRGAEFGTNGLARAELDDRLAGANSVVEEVLSGFDPARLDEPFPIEVVGVQMRTGIFLTHLCAHLAYHLGQVDAHRRITTGEGALPGIQGVAPLADEGQTH